MLSTARVTRPSTVHVLLFAGLVLHALRVPRPKAPPNPPGRHRAPDAPRPSKGHGIAAWVWTCVAAGYGWLTWRMAVIELPPLVAVGAVMTYTLAYTAGRTARRDR